MAATATSMEEVTLDVRGRREKAMDAFMPVMNAVKTVGGSVIGIAIITLVVNKILTVDAINNSTGPFTGVINTLNTTGESAMTLLVVALLVLAAGAIMQYMGRGF